jgi:Uncharacterized protein conserved in bacteria
VQGGKLKALALTQPKRAAIAPDVPTMVEAGVEGYSAGIWMGLLAPAGTPSEIVDKLSRAANEALKSKEVLALMEVQGVDPLGGTPAEFAQFIDDELKKWDGVVKAAGIKNEIRFWEEFKYARIENDGVLAATLLAAFADNTARAQSDYPNKPIRLVVGFTPGSVADITARVLGNRMGQILGQSVVVENRPGAGSNLAAEFVARSAKDGYTLFLPGSANIANAAINPNLPFDIAKDFAPVALVSAAAVILVVHPSLAVNNIQELIALAKSKPAN